MSLYCKHVYEHIDAETCPDCGNVTHNIDWVAQAELHKEWVESGKATPSGVWWSI